MPDFPVVDLRDLAGPQAGRQVAARAIDAACREPGFFAVVGHGVDPALPASLATQAREFFALDAAEKAEIGMARGGRAWRGWFPPGGELTSGAPDRKEGIYFGTELGPDDPRVRAGVPLHGPNLFPTRPAGLRAAVLAYVDALGIVGRTVLRGIARALGLDERTFEIGLTADPTVLFRIFRYPRARPDDTTFDISGWGVAEHTDYGLLTLLWQDDVGGLEVHGRDRWIDVPARPDALVCNLGDMLERMTGGVYRSTPHRVRVPTDRDRIAMPFFFDPGWDAPVGPLPIAEAAPRVERARWDGADLHAWSGTYGDYLLAKVARVFPALGDEVLG